MPAWQRWYDYGIGLFRESDRGTGRGALRQADEAFVELARMAPSLGALARDQSNGYLLDGVRIFAHAEFAIASCVRW